MVTRLAPCTCSSSSSGPARRRRRSRRCGRWGRGSSCRWTRRRSRSRSRRRGSCRGSWPAAANRRCGRDFDRLAGHASSSSRVVPPVWWACGRDIMPPAMGQPINVVEKPSLHARRRPLRDQPLAHRHGPRALRRRRHARPPARRRAGPPAVRHGGVTEVHANSSMVTVHLVDGWTGEKLLDVIRGSTSTTRPPRPPAPRLRAVLLPTGANRRNSVSRIPRQTGAPGSDRQRRRSQEETMSSRAWQAVLDHSTRPPSWQSSTPTSTACCARPRRVLEVSVPSGSTTARSRSSPAGGSTTTPPGAGQGRHPLPPRPRRRRGQGAGGDDDLQDRPGRPALRRAKGGVAVRPRTLSITELERVTRRFTYEISPILGPEADIPAPRRQHRRPGDGLADGHPVDGPGAQPARLGDGQAAVHRGTRSHAGATSAGCLDCARAACPASSGPAGGQPGGRAGLRQGGGPLAFLLSSAGMRGRASATSAGRCSTRAASTWALADHVAETGSVAGFAGGEPSRRRHVGHRRASCWCPRRWRGHRRRGRAHRAKLVVEAANGPTTVEAQPVLDRQGMVVVPDILANAGGVTASYFEWAQAQQGYPWEDHLVAERLRQRMEHAFTEVRARAHAGRRHAHGRARGGGRAGGRRHHRPRLFP